MDLQLIDSPDAARRQAEEEALFACIMSAQPCDVCVEEEPAAGR